jgi:hypothetical protein
MRTTIFGFVGGVAVGASAFMPLVTGTGASTAPAFVFSTMTGLPTLVAGAFIAATAFAVRAKQVRAILAGIAAATSAIVAAVLAFQNVTAPVGIPSLGNEVSTLPIATMSIDYGFVALVAGLALVAIWVGSIAVRPVGTSDVLATP